jgi:hypothetical protein
MGICWHCTAMEWIDFTKAVNASLWSSCGTALL